MGGLTKNQRRRLKKRAQKQAEANGIEIESTSIKNGSITPTRETSIASTLNVEVEYVSADLSKELALPPDDPNYEEMMRVFGKFSSAEELCGTTDNEDVKDEEKKENDGERDEEEGVKKKEEGVKKKEEEDDEQVLSRKARKKNKRLSVAELKQLVSYPDVVEAHDVTSADPRLLVYLKSYRNTVPVPHHWCHKRKYLQGKRGIEKPPFKLPEFIAQTGIAEVRESVTEDDEKKKNKQKARERVQPKMGRVDIDYQVLHDAFFRFQTKPKLTQLGDLYYEGKEFEVKLKTKVPGQLSDELKAALGMVEGVPPPWLLNVQRYGPPPAYPNLKIPGLNAPIPEGASFGYHPGGWGKPPVDENGVPLYGDVFSKAVETEHQDEEINRERWGELEEEEAEDEDEENEEKDEEAEDLMEGDSDAKGLDATGLETPLVDGISSVASGLTTPGIVDLRKGLRGTETPDAPQQLYTVLEQRETSVGTSLYGSGHAYVVPGAAEILSSGTRTETGRVRRRFEDVPPSESADPTEDKEEAVQKKKKAKTEKSKKLKDFKF
ncbi:unnamed protein product [Peronospora belbahrii]|uniref:PSP proline-rich domain-containing protein n=1 Tax=Peronospora belbahrii TaxID=622444 RepID=A0ABN8D1B3_9STRA|nr:unnamed protein product [Peronospora belbahrii]